MWVAAAVRMPVARPDIHATHLQHGDRIGGVHIAYTPALDFRPGGLCEDPVKPKIVVESDPHNHARRFHAGNVLRFLLVVFGVEIGRYQAGRRDAFATDCFNQAA